MQRYTDTLKPMHDAYIEPSKAHADVVILSHQNNPKAVSLLRAYIQSQIAIPK
jgi:uridine kinase